MIFILHYSKKQPEPKLKFKGKIGFVIPVNHFQKLQGRTRHCSLDMKRNQGKPACPLHSRTPGFCWNGQSGKALSAEAFPEAPLIGLRSSLRRGPLRKVMLGKLCNVTECIESLCLSSLLYRHCRLCPVKHTHL